MPCSGSREDRQRPLDNGADDTHQPVPIEKERLAMPKKKIARTAREVVEAPPAPKRGPGRPRKEDTTRMLIPTVEAKRRPGRKAAVAKARTQLAPAPAPRNGQPRAGTKTEKIYKLLTRKSGCTRAEVLKATNWPAISIQKISETLGLKLRKDDANRPYRYYGSP
jgi:hypothetical protein